MSQADFFTLNCRGRLLSLERPRIMGILNLTPDSFSDGGQHNRLNTALHHSERMLREGADIIDIGGYSSRPYAIDIPPEEELSRIESITGQIMARFPEAIISIDTFRSAVARPMLEAGVHIINDISGGKLDPGMMDLVSSYENVPYLLMHMQGRPQNMQDDPQYQDIVDDIYQYFIGKVQQAREAGIKDLVLDPGFGFGKTIGHNFQLLQGLAAFQTLGCPILVGLSRKSMLYKVLGTTPEETIPQSQVLHDHALRRGANILRVHDVLAAKRTVDLYLRMREDGVV